MPPKKLSDAFAESQKIEVVGAGSHEEDSEISTTTDLEMEHGGEEEPTSVKSSEKKGKKKGKGRDAGGDLEMKETTPSTRHKKPHKSEEVVESSGDDKDQLEEEPSDVAPKAKNPGKPKVTPKTQVKLQKKKRSISATTAGAADMVDSDENSDTVSQRDKVKTKVPKNPKSVAKEAASDDEDSDVFASGDETIKPPPVKGFKVDSRESTTYNMGESIKRHITKNSATSTDRGALEEVDTLNAQYDQMCKEHEADKKTNQQREAHVKEMRTFLKHTQVVADMTLKYPENDVMINQFGSVCAGSIETEKAVIVFTKSLLGMSDLKETEKSEDTEMQDA